MRLGTPKVYERRALLTQIWARWQTQLSRNLGPFSARQGLWPTVRVQSSPEENNVWTHCRLRRHRVVPCQTRPTIHAPCTHPRVSPSLRGQTANSHESFERSCRTHATTLPNTSRHRPRCVTAARRRESSTVASEKAATSLHRVRSAVLRQHSGHSGVMTAVSTGLAQQSADCPGRT